MKAAVLHHFGDTPRYEDFPDPAPGKNEKLIHMKAAALENFDRMTAAGTHYSSRKLFPRFPAIAGHGGIGMTEDGRLVGFATPRPPYGAFAEKVVTDRMIPVPEGVDPAIAATLPSAALTSLLSLKYRAKLRQGETVLVNGATGVSGKIAIQIAKKLGAGRVVGSGRNKTILSSLRDLGADAVIDLQQPDEQLAALFEKEAGDKPYDVVIDFIWGHPAEVLLRSFIPREAGFAKSRIRYIHIGEKAGSTIALSGEMLRTSGVEIYGVGSIQPEALQESLGQVWEWEKEKSIHIDIERIPLSDIAKAWQRESLEGKRLVVIP